MDPGAKQRSCIFCRRSPPEVKITKEHILPKKFAKLVPTKIKRMVHRAFVINTAKQVATQINREKPEGPFSETTNKVCKRCNDGLLNGIEIAAEDALIGTINSQRFTLNKPQLDALAIWANKTAAMRATVDSEAVRLPPAYYWDLYENQGVPATTRVWLADVGNIDDVYMQHDSRVFEGALEGRCHFCTVSVNSLFLHIVIVVGRDATLLHDHFREVIEHATQGTAIDISRPNVFSTVQWPMRAKLNVPAREISYLLGRYCLDTFGTPTFDPLVQQ